LKQGFPNSIRQASYAENATQADDIQEEEETGCSKEAEGAEVAQSGACTPARDNHQILNEKQHQILNERKTDLRWKVIKS
jgi:hypothetical protein